MKTKQSEPALVLIAGTTITTATTATTATTTQDVLQQAGATLRESWQYHHEVLATLERSYHIKEAGRAIIQESRDLLKVLKGSAAEQRYPRLFPLVTLPLLSKPVETVELSREALPTEEKRWLSIQEAATRGGMTDGAVRSALYKRRISYIQWYGRKLIRTTDFDAYRASARVGRPRKKAG